MPRASSRFATFAQAISSTSATAHASTMMPRRTVLIAASCSGIIIVVQPRLE
jgi:hypothetical protein